jgi:hypothetical protein
MTYGFPTWNRIVLYKVLEVDEKFLADYGVNYWGIGNGWCYSTLD